MRRINLIVSQELRSLAVAYTSLCFNGVLARVAAEVINDGAQTLLKAEKEVQSALISNVKGIYPDLKSGRHPTIVIYIDVIDKVSFDRIRVAHSLHPRSRAYRILLAIGLAGAVEDLKNSGVAETPLLARLSELSDRL